jgi:hypothetical protein
MGITPPQFKHKRPVTKREDTVGRVLGPATKSGDHGVAERRLHRLDVDCISDARHGDDQPFTCFCE